MSRTIFFFPGLTLWYNSCNSVKNELVDNGMFVDFKIIIIISRFFNFFVGEEFVKSMDCSAN